ncbi:MAG TPA: polysaccharide biosynthesis C-terminal domain-containing protein [Fluviicola sp.]|nr:polysaccharide biosynthesis C-terminal domain-containing protein [Fluviicola sp.]
MLFKIIQTVFSKGISSFFNLLSILIVTNYLGASGRGEMVILLLALTMVGVFQSVLSGAALTYMVPRYPIDFLTQVTTAWIVLSSISISVVLGVFYLFPLHDLMHLIFLSIFSGLIGFHQNLLLGFEKITQQNVIEIIKAISLTGALLVSILIFKLSLVYVFIVSYYISFGITFLVSFTFCLPYFSKSLLFVRINKTDLLFYFKIGMQMQINNIIQMLNYRFCFYLIEKKIGVSALGIFSVATSIMETIWIFCKSVSIVYYSKSVNLGQLNKNIQLTLKLSFLNMIITLLTIGIVFLLPNSFYLHIFGDDFYAIKSLFISLFPGVLFLACFTIFNYHFSSINKNAINIYGSLIGAVLIVLVSFLFIDTMGMHAAGMATSIGYFGMTCYLIARFFNMYNLKVKDVIQYLK